MKSIIIYGAGIYGRRVLECYIILNVNVKAFLVTKKTNDMDEVIDGIPIYDLSEINKDAFAESKVIVAVDEHYHQDIRKSLNDWYGEFPNDNLTFYSKRDIDELYRKTHPIDEKNAFLHSVEPVSRLFGNDRGTPIDRYYIEKYLERESKKLGYNGYSLEVGEDTYSKKFFPKYVHDVLDYTMGMDLTKKETLPKDKYDVFVCTQVFHQIYDVRSAIQGAYHLLKNNGIMLATVCGNITKIARNDEYEHYWGFTKLSIENLVKEVFGNEVCVETYGNCMAATSFIQGVSLEEIDKSLLDVSDIEYTICISISAKKNETSYEKSSIN